MRCKLLVTKVLRSPHALEKHAWHRQCPVNMLRRRSVLAALPKWHLGCDWGAQGVLREGIHKSQVLFR